jgi:hypothetical protein
MKEIIVKEKCEIKIPLSNLVIFFDGKKTVLSLQGNANLMVGGDFSIGCMGKLSIISKDSVNIDSVNSNINLNCKDFNKL